MKRKWGNVESESLSISSFSLFISSFSLHFLFIFSFSLRFLTARMPGWHILCSPGTHYCLHHQDLRRGRCLANDFLHCACWPFAHLYLAGSYAGSFRWGGGHDCTHAHLKQQLHCESSNVIKNIMVTKTTSVSELRSLLLPGSFVFQNTIVFWEFTSRRYKSIQSSGVWLLFNSPFPHICETTNEFFFSVAQSTERMEDYEISRKEGPLASFQKQLAASAISKEFTDVTLVCKDMKPVALHRVVLSAASLWFR